MKPKFDKGDRVKVKGHPGIHVVYWPSVVPIPSIVKSQFVLVDAAMYKFRDGPANWFYAWEEDVKKWES